MQEYPQQLIRQTEITDIKSSKMHTTGEPAPVLLQNFWHLEKLIHCNREQIPGNPVHAKSLGAFGSFTLTRDITPYTKTGIFSGTGKRTPVLARFSLPVNKGNEANTTTDENSFALKFYTNKGIWDLVSYRASNLNGIEIPQSSGYSPYMQDFSSQPYTFINAQDMRFYGKFQFRRIRENRIFNLHQPNGIAGKEQEDFQCKLFEQIEKRNFPGWKVYIRLIPLQNSPSERINPKDHAKSHSLEDHPCIEIGILELNRNPENYFAEIEQAVFNPVHTIPGIAFSPEQQI